MKETRCRQSSQHYDEIQSTLVNEIFAKLSLYHSKANLPRNVQVAAQRNIFFLL